MDHDSPSGDLQYYKELSEKYQLLAENTVECIWLLDFTSRRFQYISPSILQLRGFTPEEAMAQSLEDAMTPESLLKMEQTAKEIHAAIVSGDANPMARSSINEYQQYCKDGSIKDIEVSTRVIINEKENTISVLGVSRDISQRKELEARLSSEIDEKNRLIARLHEKEQELTRLMEELQAKNTILNDLVVSDKLTGAFNRYYFDLEVNKAIQHADRYGLPLSMIFFDLDHFKNVNDQYGHDTGDAVLQDIAAIIKQNLHAPCLFARWGGEEFILLLPQTSLAEAAQIAEDFRILISQSSFSSSVHITASFGVAQWQKGEDLERWFRRMDHALYQAKHNGRNRVSVYSTTESLPVATIRLEWHTEWESGHPVIDDQHRMLLALSNRLLDCSFDEIDKTCILPSLDDLLNHIVQHFQDEERIQLQVGYPRYGEHKKIHARLVEKALRMKQLFLQNVLKHSLLLSFLLEDVLMGHMLAEDVKFFPYIKKDAVHT